MPANEALFSKAEQSFKASRLSEAAELFQGVLARDPRHTGSLYRLGAIALRIGHAEGAIKLSLQAIALAPDHAGAHRTLADAFAITGRLTEAKKHYQRALELKPDADTYANLATILAAGNDIESALHAAIRGLKIRETPKLKSLFINCLRRDVPTTDNADMHAFLLRALSEPWQRPGNMARVSVALVKQDPGIAKAMRCAAERWPGRATLAELYGPEGLAVVGRNRLLHVILENTQFADVALERLLTLTRSGLLDAVISGVETGLDDEDIMSFFCALAQQCFTNEYIFACSAGEIEKVCILRDRLTAAAQHRTHIAPSALAAVAAYRPLHTVSSCEALLDLSWPDPAQKLLMQQIREPAAERALRSSIPQLTPIDDDGTSALVRLQYEENPYPRWVKTSPDIAPDTLDRMMQNRQPLAPYSPLGKTEAVDVLIAGCGTGQQVVEIATSILNAQVTAVDLSLSSLCYAKHRTDALGLNNITYGQADILELASLGRAFDLIVCSGVLHHMADPLRGWRALLSVLRPQGLMRIALYSEAGRADVVAAREFIAAQGYGASVEDIRRARQEIMALDDASLAKGVVESGDFFGTSTCRDFLFHVQEQRFTLPQIKAFLAENDLEFLGFVLRAERRRDYLALFPDDRACINLDNWDQFERRHPVFFRGMYQFHVQRRS